MRIKVEKFYPSKRKVIFMPPMLSFGYDHTYSNEKSLFLVVGCLFWIVSFDFIIWRKDDE